jgi:hypothetical protein
MSGLRVSLTNVHIMKTYLLTLFLMAPAFLFGQSPDSISWQDLDIRQKPVTEDSWTELDLATKPIVSDYWDELDLVGYSYKDPKKFPWWALTPIAIVPPVLWVILDEDEPDPPIPVTPPVIICPDPLTLTWGQPLPAPDIDLVSVSSNCPEGFTVIYVRDDNNGGSGCAGDPLVYTRIYEVTDNCGNTVTCTQEFTYLTDEEGPELACPVDVTVECDQTDDLSLTGQPLATDNCTPQDQITLTYEDDESGLTDCGGTGALLRTWTATDLCGNTSTCSQQITVVDLTTPILNCPPNITVNCGEETVLSITGEATATDNCTENVSITYEDDTGGFSECEGVIIRTWTATDECGNETICEQEITVNAVDCAFELNLAILFADCGQANGAISTAIDPPGSYEYLWSNGETGPDLNNIPAGLYTVSITDIEGNCTEFVELEVGEFPPAYVEILQVDPASCNVCGDIILDLTGEGPFDLTLTGPVTFNLTDIPPGDINLGDITCLETGNYTIEVVDIGNGGVCTDVVVIDVPYIPPFELSVVETIPPSSPGAMDGAVTLMINPPTILFPATVIVNGVVYDQVNDPIIVIESLGEGTYTIFVIEDPTGCESPPVTVVLEAGPMLYLPIHKLVQLNSLEDFPNWSNWHSEAYDLNTVRDYLQDWIVEHPAPTINGPLDYTYELPLHVAAGYLFNENLMLELSMTHVRGTATAPFDLEDGSSGTVSSSFNVNRLESGLRQSIGPSEEKIRPYIGLGASWDRMKQRGTEAYWNDQQTVLADPSVKHRWSVYWMSGVVWTPSPNWQITLEASGAVDQEYQGVGLRYRF